VTRVAVTVDFQSHLKTAMLNAPMMECDRIYFRGNEPVQKRQQIFEIVRVRHRGTSFCCSPRTIGHGQGLA
jgi:hypothetical protein